MTHTQHTLYSLNLIPSSRLPYFFYLKCISCLGSYSSRSDQGDIFADLSIYHDFYFVLLFQQFDQNIYKSLTFLFRLLKLIRYIKLYLFHKESPSNLFISVRLIKMFINDYKTKIINRPLMTCKCLTYCVPHSDLYWILQHEWNSYSVTVNLRMSTE